MFYLLKLKALILHVGARVAKNLGIVVPRSVVLAFTSTLLSSCMIILPALKREVASVSELVVEGIQNSGDAINSTSFNIKYIGPDFDNATQFESIPVTDARVTGSGTATLSINPTANFVSSGEYCVFIDATATVHLTLRNPASSVIDYNGFSVNFMYATLRTRTKIALF